MSIEELKGIMQAIIYVADEPVTFEQLEAVFADETAENLKIAVTELMAEFNRSQKGLEIRQIAGGYRISTRPEHHEWITAYLKTKPGARLSLAALETLAVIAYKQPITVPEILHIRGLKATSAIKTLLEKKLIIPRGRKPVVGRPMMYGTSKDFLVHFGLNDLADLPTLEEFEELSNSQGNGNHDTA